MTLIKRHSDGKLFKPDYPRTPEEGNPFSGLLSGKHLWFFREVKPIGWWIFKYYKYTGNYWKTHEHNTWDIVK